jgi:hypothetical protein
MENDDKFIIVLFILVIIVFLVTLNQINKFMPVLKTCDDDFKIIEKCHCVPCSWNQSKYYKNESCLNLGQ